MNNIIVDLYNNIRQQKISPDINNIKFVQYLYCIFGLSNITPQNKSTELQDYSYGRFISTKKQPDLIFTKKNNPIGKIHWDKPEYSEEFMNNIMAIETHNLVSSLNFNNSFAIKNK